MEDPQRHERERKPWRQVSPAVGCPVGHGGSQALHHIGSGCHGKLGSRANPIR